MRLQTGLPWDTPVSALLQKSGQLSVQQLTAYHSLLQVYKTRRSRQPAYFYAKLFPDGDLLGPRTTRSQTNQNIRIDLDLSLARPSFFYRASRLWNNLPIDLRNQASLAAYKKGVKLWIRDHVKGVP